MSAPPEAIERKIVAKETEVERVKKQLEDAIGDRDRELLRQELAALRQELAALQQQLAALQQQLAALQQKEVLLMQQQAGAAGSQRSWQPTSAAYQASLQQPWRAAFPSCQQCTHNMLLCFHYITLLSLSHHITE
jgi:predicted  nucleic acid-binding Zn-ribbon protein